MDRHADPNPTDSLEQPLKIIARAALTAALVGLVVYFPEFEDGSGSILAGISAFAGVALGLAAVDRVRTLPARGWVERARISGLAVALGLVLGWVFWRWGVPYSYACHAVANGTHLVLMLLLF